MQVYNVKEKANAVITCGLAGGNIINGVMAYLTAIKKVGETNTVKDLATVVVFEGAGIVSMGVGIALTWAGVTKMKIASTAKTNIEKGE